MVGRRQRQPVDAPEQRLLRRGDGQPQELGIGNELDDVRCSVVHDWSPISDGSGLSNPDLASSSPCLPPHRPPKARQKACARCWRGVSAGTDWGSRTDAARNAREGREDSSDTNQGGRKEQDRSMASRSVSGAGTRA